MKKRIKGRTLSRSATQRKALKRTMLVSLVKSDSIKTTLAKAKELKPFAERMITRAKRIKKDDKNSLITTIRQLKKEVPVETAKKLVDIAKNYKDRNGGYLRIVKLSPRKSDFAEMAVLEWVINEKKVMAKADGKNNELKKDQDNIDNKLKADQNKSGKSNK